jgi:hypothetical protein
MLNGVASQLDQAANSALYPNFVAAREMFLSVERTIGLKYQVGVLHGDIDIRFVPGSRAVPQVIKLDKGVFGHEFYFTQSTMPTQNEKASLRATLEKLSAERRVSEDTFFAVANLIEEGDIRKAQFYLSVASSKADEQARARTLEDFQAQAGANAQSAQKAEEARAAAEIAIMDKNKELEVFKADLAEKKAQADHQRNKEMETIKSMHKVVVDAQQIV